MVFKEYEQKAAKETGQNAWLAVTTDVKIRGCARRGFFSSTRFRRGVQCIVFSNLKHSL